MWQATFRDVSFNLSAEVSSIKVYKDYGHDSNSPTEVASLAQTGTLRLQDGDYGVVPAGENIDTSAIRITVSETSTKFEINPPFNENYLEKQRQQEINSIHSAIKTSYASIIDGYIIGDGKVLLNGSWYTTYIRPKELTTFEMIGTSVNYYKVVLEKVDGSWQVKIPPKLIIKYTDYPKVPRDVINQANFYFED
jgi:hypothetical protein